MKHLAFGLVIIMGLSSGCWAITEEELLKLPLDKLWEGIQSNTSPELKKQFVDAYNLRMMKLKVGEDRWEIYQQFRVIKAEVSVVWSPSLMKLTMFRGAVFSENID